MIGCSEFCGYYDWTFEWLRRNYGEDAVMRYWTEAISIDSQRHARELIIPKGIAGMVEYWDHTLEEEQAGYTTTHDLAKGYYRTDMFACPSLGYNLERGFSYYHDYCQHCMGWIASVLAEAGFVIHHAHNHCGQCYWEMWPKDADPGPSEPGELSGEDDIRLRDDWEKGKIHRWKASELIEE